MSEKETEYKVKEHQLFSCTWNLWRKLRKDNEISPSKKRLARKITIVVLLLSPFRLIQKIALKRRLKKFELTNDSPVFVIGHWRSGTTHLHYLLSQDPQFNYIGSFQAFFFNIAFSTRSFFKPIAKKLMPDKRPQDNVKIGVDLPQEEEHAFVNLTDMSGMHLFFFPRNRDYIDKYICFNALSNDEISKWKKMYHSMMKQIALFGDPNKRLLLKNPHSTGRIKTLLELYPNAKFIYIHRNPYDVYNSTQTLYNKTIRSQFLQDFSSDELNDLILYGYEKIIQTYIEKRNLIPKDQLYEVAYSDLLLQPMDTMKDLYSALKLGDFELIKPEFQKYLESIKEYKVNPSKPIEKGILKEINAKWGFAFKEFDYPIQE